MRIKGAFQDPDARQRCYEPLDKEFSEASKALFDIECPHVECVEGGFSLAGAVDGTVDGTLTTSMALLACQGWQDRERVNKNRCLLEGSFDIGIEYKE